MCLQWTKDSIYPKIIKMMSYSHVFVNNIWKLGKGKLWKIEIHEDLLVILTLLYKKWTRNYYTLNKIELCMTTRVYMFINC